MRRVGVLLLAMMSGTLNNKEKDLLRQKDRSDREEQEQLERGGLRCVRRSKKKTNF